MRKNLKTYHKCSPLPSQLSFSRLHKDTRNKNCPMYAHGFETYQIHLCEQYHIPYMSIHEQNIKQRYHLQSSCLNMIFPLNSPYGLKTKASGSHFPPPTLTELTENSKNGPVCIWVGKKGWLPSIRQKHEDISLHSTAWKNLGKEKGWELCVICFPSKGAGSQNLKGRNREDWCPQSWGLEARTGHRTALSGAP